MPWSHELLHGNISFPLSLGSASRPRAAVGLLASMWSPVAASGADLRYLVLVADAACERWARERECPCFWPCVVVVLAITVVVLLLGGLVCLIKCGRQSATCSIATQTDVEAATGQTQRLMPSAPEPGTVFFTAFGRVWHCRGDCRGLVSGSNERTIVSRRPPCRVCVLCAVDSPRSGEVVVHRPTRPHFCEKLAFARVRRSEGFFWMLFSAVSQSLGRLRRLDGFRGVSVPRGLDCLWVGRWLAPC